jgi:hypothetical protein
MTNLLDVCFQMLSVRPVTMGLVERLLWDQPLTPAQTVDFGVDTENHYRALQLMVRDACSRLSDTEDEEAYGFVILDLRRVALQLDQALGNGEKLNALVKTYVPEYASMVHFHTTWDELLSRTAEAVEETSAKVKT